MPSIARALANSVDSGTGGRDSKSRGSGSHERPEDGRPEHLYNKRSSIIDERNTVKTCKRSRSEPKPEVPGASEKSEPSGTKAEGADNDQKGPARKRTRRSDELSENSRTGEADTSASKNERDGNCDRMKGSITSSSHSNDALKQRTRGTSRSKGSNANEKTLKKDSSADSVKLFPAPPPLMPRSSGSGGTKAKSGSNAAGVGTKHESVPTDVTQLLSLLTAVLTAFLNQLKGNEPNYLEDDVVSPGGSGHINTVCDAPQDDGSVSALLSGQSPGELGCAASGARRGSPSLLPPLFSQTCGTPAPGCRDYCQVLRLIYGLLQGGRTDKDEPGALTAAVGGLSSNARAAEAVHLAMRHLMDAMGAARRLAQDTYGAGILTTRGGDEPGAAIRLQVAKGQRLMYHCLLSYFIYSNRNSHIRQYISSDADAIARECCLGKEAEALLGGDGEAVGRDCAAGSLLRKRGLHELDILSNFYKECKVPEALAKLLLHHFALVLLLECLPVSICTGRYDGLDEIIIASKRDILFYLDKHSTHYRQRLPHGTAAYDGSSANTSNILSALLASLPLVQLPQLVSLLLYLASPAAGTSNSGAASGNDEKGKNSLVLLGSNGCTKTLTKLLNRLVAREGVLEALLVFDLGVEQEYCAFLARLGDAFPKSPVPPNSGPGLAAPDGPWRIPASGALLDHYYGKHLVLLGCTAPGASDSSMSRTGRPPKVGERPGVYTITAHQAARKMRETLRAGDSGSSESLSSGLDYTDTPNGALSAANQYVPSVAEAVLRVLTSVMFVLSSNDLSQGDGYTEIGRVGSPETIKIELSAKTDSSHSSSKGKGPRRATISCTAWQYDDHALTTVQLLRRMVLAAWCLIERSHAAHESLAHGSLWMQSGAPSSSPTNIDENTPPRAKEVMLTPPPKIDTASADLVQLGHHTTVRQSPFAAALMRQLAVVLQNVAALLPVNGSLGGTYSDTLHGLLLYAVFGPSTTPAGEPLFHLCRAPPTGLANDTIRGDEHTLHTAIINRAVVQAALAAKAAGPLEAECLVRKLSLFFPSSVMLLQSLLTDELRAQPHRSSDRDADTSGHSPNGRGSDRGPFESFLVSGYGFVISFLVVIEELIRGFACRRLAESVSCGSTAAESPANSGSCAKKGRDSRKAKNAMANSPMVMPCCAPFPITDRALLLLFTFIRDLAVVLDHYSTAETANKNDYACALFGVAHRVLACGLDIISLYHRQPPAGRDAAPALLLGPGRRNTLLTGLFHTVGLRAYRVLARSAISTLSSPSVKLPSVLPQDGARNTAGGGHQEIDSSDIARALFSIENNKNSDKNSNASMISKRSRSRSKNNSPSARKKRGASADSDDDKCSARNDDATLHKEQGSPDSRGKKADRADTFSPAPITTSTMGLLLLQDGRCLSRRAPKQADGPFTPYTASPLICDEFSRSPEHYLTLEDPRTAMQSPSPRAVTTGQRSLGLVRRPPSET